MPPIVTSIILGIIGVVAFFAMAVGLGACLELFIDALMGPSDRHE